MILSVVAVVVLVATSVESANIKRFSESAFTALDVINPGEEIKAKLICPNNEVQLNFIDEEVIHNKVKINENDEAEINLEDEQLSYALTFELQQKSTSNDDVKYVIKLNDGDDMFFDVSFLKIKFEENTGAKGREVTKDEALMSLSLLLMSSDKEPILLRIPVFLAPAEISADNLNPNFGEKFATDNKVGVFSPIVENALETALKKGVVSLNLSWLEELLVRNIYTCKESDYIGENEITSYCTRPMVTSEHMNGVLIDTLNKFKSKSLIESKENESS